MRIFIQGYDMDSTTMRLGIFFLILLLMMAAEAIAPRRSLHFGRKRWPANLGIVLIDSIAVRLLLPGGAVAASMWAGANHIGLLHLFDWQPPITITVSMILLDLVIYGQHVLFHAVPYLWRLHMVHHADQDIDVTTALRFHPIEIILSMLIKIIAVALLGAPVLAVILFEIVLNGMAMFNHANLRLPTRLDQWLRMLIITPDVHRIHHSIIKSETNSNFGFNLSAWDRLFGTFREQPQQGHAAMVIGLEHLQSAPTHKLGFMLRLPFNGRIGQYPIFTSKREKQHG